MVDFLHRPVGGQEIAVAAGALLRIEPFLILGGELLRSLLRIGMLDLDTLIIDDAVGLGGILGRDLVAVMRDTLIVDPLVDLAVRVRAGTPGAGSKYRRGD